jgi:hypothetical protein
LILLKNLELGIQKGAEAGHDLAATILERVRLRLQLVAPGLCPLLDLLGLRAGLLHNVLRLLLRVLELLLGVAARLVQGLLQGLLHPLVVVHLVFKLLDLVLQAPTLVLHLLPLRRHRVEEGLDLFGVVPAEALVEVLLPYVERRQIHGVGQSVGQFAERPSSSRRPAGRSRVPGEGWGKYHGVERRERAGCSARFISLSPSGAPSVSRGRSAEWAWPKTSRQS